MESERKSDSDDEVITPAASDDSDSTLDGESSDLDVSMIPASVTTEKINASVVLPNEPPPPPTMISPGSESEPGPVITTSTPIFEWNEVKEATDYGIYIRDLAANVLAFNSNARNIKITGSSYSLPSGILKMGRAYCWIMTSQNNAGLGYFGKVFYFQTNEEAAAPAIPEPPTLISPGSESEQGPVIDTLTPTLEWTEVSGATDYGIYIRELATDAPVFDSKELGLEITGSSYSLPLGILEMGKAYTWSMTSNNSAGSGDLSASFYFQTEEEAVTLPIPEPPTPISPGSETEPGPVIDTVTPTFEWTEVNGATEYGIYIRDLTDNVLIFNSRELGIEITGSSYSLPPGILEMDRSYIWSMTAHNSAGDGDLAVIFYFQTGW